MKLVAAGSALEFPDFLILGAAKSGTTSLYFYLRQHPEIFMPADTKEPGFLCFRDRSLPLNNPAFPYPDLWKGVIGDMNRYCSLFSGAKARIIGEATPEYLYLANETIASIRSLYGDRSRDLKYVVVLRDPVDRLWSHYWMFRRDGYEQLPLEEAIDENVTRQRLASGWHPSYDYRGYGFYARQIEAYRQAFGRDRCLVVLFEDMKRDAQAVCATVFKFLGVDDKFLTDTQVVYNSSGRLRHPRLHRFLFGRESILKTVARRVIPYYSLQKAKHLLIAWNSERQSIPSQLKRELQGFYRKDVEDLAMLLCRDLSEWTA